MIALPEVKFRLLNDVRLLDEFATPGEVIWSICYS